MKNFKRYTTKSLKGIQEYYKQALEGITHYWPPKLNDKKAEKNFKVFRSQEILRIKTELNEIWKELVLRKLKGEL